MVRATALAKRATTMLATSGRMGHIIRAVANQSVSDRRRGVPAVAPGLCILSPSPRCHDAGSMLAMRPDRRGCVSTTGSAVPGLRRLLVQAAHYILGPFGPDTDLRHWGERYAGTGARNAKKRAVVAIARRLAVLMLALWKTGEVYEPLRHAASRDAA